MKPKPDEAEGTVLERGSAGEGSPALEEAEGMAVVSGGTNERMEIQELLCAADETQAIETRTAEVITRHHSVVAEDQLVLLEEITRGGMGIIFKGWDANLGREVAVKVIQEKFLPHAADVERFSNEARIAAMLQHPGVIPVYRSGWLPGHRPYFAMKLVRGETLGKLLADRSDPTADRPRFLKIFEQICQTIAYCHDQGVIHRDLKPMNIMVGRFGEVQVLDWGVAKILRAPHRTAEVAVRIEDCHEPEAPSGIHTGNGMITGTLAYMAPEQARGESDQVDERVDVFGLGGILCTILTGLPPYCGSDSATLLQSAIAGELHESLARLDSCGADVELLQLARRCLSPNRQDRPRTAGCVQGAITGYLESILQQSERDLIRFFELSLDLFCIAGMDGFFRRVNSNFTRVLGYPEQELVTRPFLQFVHEDDQAQTRSAVEQLAGGQALVRFRNRYRSRSGTYRWFEWTAKPLSNEGLIFAVARDVTDQCEG